MSIYIVIMLDRHGRSIGYLGMAGERQSRLQEALSTPFLSSAQAWGRAAVRDGRCDGFLVVDNRFPFGE